MIFMIFGFIIGIGFCCIRKSSMLGVHDRSLITYKLEKERRFKKFNQKYIELEECVICMDNINENVYELPCSHIFHKECLEMWAEKNYDCPVCRHNILDPLPPIPT